MTQVLVTQILRRLGEGTNAAEIGPDLGRGGRPRICINYSSDDSTCADQRDWPTAYTMLAIRLVSWSRLGPTDRLWHFASSTRAKTPFDRQTSTSGR